MGEDFIHASPTLPIVITAKMKNRTAQKLNPSLTPVVHDISLDSCSFLKAACLNAKLIYHENWPFLLCFSPPDLAQRSNVSIGKDVCSRFGDTHLYVKLAFFPFAKGLHSALVPCYKFAAQSQPRHHHQQGRGSALEQIACTQLVSGLSRWHLQ